MNRSLDTGEIHEGDRRGQMQQKEEVQIRFKKQGSKKGNNLR